MVPVISTLSIQDRHEGESPPAAKTGPLIQLEDSRDGEICDTGPWLGRWGMAQTVSAGCKPGAHTVGGDYQATRRWVSETTAGVVALTCTEPRQQESSDRHLPGFGAAHLTGALPSELDPENETVG
jgi:hypothetical protein